MKIYVSLFVTLFCLQLQAQDNFTVIKVTGKVLSQKSNRPLISGDKVQSKDALQFGSKDASIILFHPKTGRKVIKGVPDDSPREFMQLLQSFVKPSEKSTGTRNAGLKYLDKLQNMFSYDTILILGDGRIKVETDMIKIEKPSGFRVIYKSGNETIQRTISDNKSFSLSKMSMFGSDQPSPVPQVTIQYYVNEAEEFAFADGALLGKFVPLYANEVQLKTEVKSLIGAVSENQPAGAKLFDEVKGYLALAYGGTLDENLKNWLVANGLVK